MTLDVATLPEMLRLEKVDEHSYAAPSPHGPGEEVTRNVVFGGQILAQMIMAAAIDHDDDKEVKSIHAIFARPGDYTEPIIYEVDSMHNGRTFASDSVNYSQRGKVISRGLILWSIDEPDLIRHTANATMPDVPGPDEPGYREDGRVFPGAEGRICGGINTWSDDEPLRPAVQNVWTRFPDRIDSVAANQAILSWATDGYLIGTAMLPHEGVNEAHAHRTISTGVVSHTVNFHDRFDVSDWLLLANESVWAGRGRSYGRCNIWTTDGRLVATYTQDNIVRGFADGGDHSDNYNRVM